VQYIILPWIQFSPDLSIGLVFSVLVERIGKEINNSDFKIWLEIGKKDIELGFRSPKEDGNEIPDSTLISFMILFGINEKTRVYKFALNPQYNSGSAGKKIQLFSEYNDEEAQRGFSYEFDPAIKTQTSIKSLRNPGRWEYEYKRETNIDSKVTTVFTKNEKETSLIINKLPSNLKFQLELTPLSEGGGRFLYESDETYDIELLINSNQQGTCRYATIKNTPKKLYAEWIPTLLNGSISLNIESDGTDIILQDSLTNPITTLKINDLKTVNIDTNWNLSNPGNLIVKKELNLDANIDINIGEWNAKLQAEPSADYVEATWDLGLTGSFSIDTGWETLNSIDLLIQSSDKAISTEGETFRSDDYKLEWVLWPILQIKLIRYGQQESSAIDIDLYANDRWYNIWPWLSS